MDSETSKRALRKRARTEPLEQVRAEVLSPLVTTTSTRLSSRKRSSPRSDTRAGTSNLESVASESVSPVSNLPPGSTGTPGKGNRMYIGNNQTNGDSASRSRIQSLDDFKRREMEKADGEEAKCSTANETLSIDAFSALLARLDERSYHRSLFRDANCLSRELLQPLALPWTHQGLPVARNIPCDLDDLTEILTADDGAYTPFDNGPLGFGRVDGGQFRREPTNTRLATSETSWCAATRRSDDPGVIELASIALPPNRPNLDLAIRRYQKPARQLSAALEASPPSKTTMPFAHAPGETTLQYYEQAMDMRRRKRVEARRCVTRKLVSVRVNSSSSRSTLFSDLNMDPSSPYGRLLEATLPQEVQNGRFLSTSRAQKIAENLGTYDWRHGLAPTNHSGRNANRLSCGRTRIMWTKKNHADQPQKVYYTSLIGGERLESGAQRRPRDIKLAIRIQGEIFGSQSKSKTEIGTEIFNCATIPSSSSFAVDSPLEFKPRPQCVLEDDELVGGILLECGQRKAKHAAKMAKEESWRESNPIITYPQIECLPDSNGLINVVCTCPGKLLFESVHEQLNSSARALLEPSCTVCWSSSSDANMPLYECSICRLSVHPACCLNGGKFEEKTNTWKCSSCSANDIDLSGTDKKPKRKSRPPLWLQDSHVPGGIPSRRGSIDVDAAESSSQDRDADHQSNIDTQPKAAGRKSQPTLWLEGSIPPIDGTSIAKIPRDGEDQPKYKCRKCLFCPFQGGAMSPIVYGGEEVWVHEFCRVWLLEVSGLQSRVPPAPNDEVCILCGQGDANAAPRNPVPRRLVKCAASRCHLYFHPMCALLSTKLLSDIRGMSPGVNNTLEKTKGMDRALCHQFTFSAVDCEFPLDAKGNDPGVRRKVTFPIVFCGIHNPQRKEEFHGLYPGGKHMTPKTLRVPTLDSPQK